MHVVHVCVCIHVPDTQDVSLCPSTYKRVNLCNCECPFKGPSQSSPRPFDQVLYDMLALGGPQNGKVCSGWELVDIDMG